MSDGVRNVVEIPEDDGARRVIGSGHRWWRHDACCVHRRMVCEVDAASQALHEAPDIGRVVARRQVDDRWLARVAKRRRTEPRDRGRSRIGSK